jgi:hypothetical protein
MELKLEKDTEVKVIRREVEGGKLKLFFEEDRYLEVDVYYSEGGYMNRKGIYALIIEKEKTEYGYKCSPMQSTRIVVEYLNRKSRKKLEKHIERIHNAINLETVSQKELTSIIFKTREG